MKQTLTWNVTGIPPEAREIARAAAARDGMSVGDWITRRIYTESQPSGREQQVESPSMRVEPPSTAYRAERNEETRRDREELMRRLARSEAETDSAFRRIDETLRTLGRRLETTERSQNEAKFSAHTATTELNATNREHLQNFGNLVRRVEGVERASDSSPLRNAVRGLHEGLSRLAEQVAKTANDSSTRIETLARNVNGISETAKTARAESGHLATNIEERLKALTDKLARSEERLDGVEERVQETFGRHASSVERKIEDVSERLNQVERSQDEKDGSAHESVRAIQDRIAASEKHSQESLAELRQSLAEITRRLGSMDILAPGQDPQGFIPESNEIPATPAMEPPTPTSFVPEDQSFDLPPFPGADDTLEVPLETELQPDPSNEHDPQASNDEFPTLLPGTGNEFAPDQETMRPAHGAEDYLSAARRAAKTAAEANPRANHLGLASAHMGGNRRVRRDKSFDLRRQLLAISAGLLLVLGVGYLVLSSGLVPFSDSFGPGQAALPPPTAYAWEPSFSLPPIHGPEAMDTSSELPAGALTTLPSAANQAPTYSSNIDQYASLNPPTALPSPPPTAAAPTPPAPELPPEAPPAPSPPPVAVTEQAVSGPELSTETAGSNSPSPLDRLLSQARSGSPAAALLVGLKYLDGDGVAVSESEGVRWLRTAAEQGEPVAQYRLGSIYERGSGVPADLGQAAFWYEQAARSGNRNAMHNLAVAFADGNGTEKNLAEAARWFRSAADLGLTDSQFNLAVLYERGMGVPSSLPEAYKWYVIAAEQGDTEARSRVEVLATQLPEDQRVTTERAAASYAPQPLDQAANEPPTLAQLQ